MSDRIELTIEKLASGGDGIAFSGGRVVFVPFSIPGEKIACEIIRDQGDYLRASILEIREPSPARVTPPCPVFGRCGGCSLQHMEYSRQLAWKADAVREAFSRIAGIRLAYAADFSPEAGDSPAPGSIPFSVHQGKAYGYRNRVQLHFSDDHGIGYMEASSAASLRAHGCPVATKVVDDWLKKRNRASRADKELAARIGERERFVVFGQDNRIYIEGMDAMAEATVAGRRYRFPLKHFFQSNLEMAGKLVDDAVTSLAGDVAVDLYSGAGLFAARLTESFGQVLCVESDSVSLEAARTNLPKGRGRFYPVDVDNWIAGQKTKKPAGEMPRYDLVLADPPRQGLSPATREWLSKGSADRFIYVSCDPVTMARDIGVLVRSGWSLESLAMYDFYPQTGHVEALARLSPA
jgi:23S rRNA (uracil1939-C5)-methyltransferase